MTALRRSIAAAAVTLLIACGGDGTGPTAGTLTVSLTTPNSGLDGAAIIVLSGPAVPGSVTPAAGLTLWGGPVSTTTATIALTGTLSTGTILTLQVDDTRQAAQYSATLQQVAVSTTPFTLRQLLGYLLTVTQ
ncbi:MAG: hypothetical protein ACREMW_13485 [Gemmatimonadales bacterium]